MRSKIDPDQLAELKGRHRLSDLFERAGIKVRGGSCLCPFHFEKTPSCKVYDREGKFHCYGCGAHGDHIDFMVARTGYSFWEAVEALGGVHEIADIDRSHWKKEREKAAAAESAEREKKLSSAQALFKSGGDIKGTGAAAYWRNRGLVPAPSMTGDLRFIASLEYHGYEDAKADRTKTLGEFPAMLAAIRNPQTMNIIGCHRTYLDPETHTKLTPPGDRRRNKAKKIVGEFLGGLIFLSPPADTLVCGEGIETSLSGAALEVGGYSDVAIAAAVNLFNLAGGCLSTVQDPRHINDTKRRLPNGEPDPERPGFLPPTWAKRIILLGDGDSDALWTRAMMLAAGKRMQALGLEAEVAMAPASKDWNNVLMEDAA